MQKCIEVSGHRYDVFLEETGELGEGNYNLSFNYRTSPARRTSRVDPDVVTNLGLGQFRKLADQIILMCIALLDKDPLGIITIAGSSDSKRLVHTTMKESLHPTRELKDKSLQRIKLYKRVLTAILKELPELDLIEENKILKLKKKP